MKILHIIYSLSSGGAERFVVDLSNKLASNSSVDVTIATILDDSIKQNSFYRPLLSSKVHYVNIGTSKGISLKSLIAVYKLIRQTKPDVVHIHCNLLLLICPIFIISNITYIHTLHTLAEKCLYKKWMLPLYKSLYRSYVKPVCISSECKKSFEGLYGMIPFCIYNGRSLLTLTPKYDNIKNEILAYKNSPNDKVFICVARYTKPKNHNLLLKAFENVCAKFNNIVLLLIGRDFDEKIIAQYQNNDKIYFLGEKFNVGDYLACSDYFVLSSLYEGLPLSLLEAMSMGVIPVATPVGGIPDVIKDGETGFLSNSLELVDYENALVRAIENHENITSQYLKEYYLQHFSMKQCAEQYYKLYTDLNNDR